MAENLWQLRKQRGMSLKQLAAKAGIKFEIVEGYENGEPIRASDLAKLAKVLYVDEFAIKVRSDLKPVQKQPPRSKPESGNDNQPAEKKKPGPKMAQPGHISQILRLSSKIGLTEVALIDELGKPLDSLRLKEAKDCINDLTERLKGLKEARRQARTESERPPGTRRKRAELPEGVDEFELIYLTERREQGDLLNFVLLTGETARGSITGFSPYTIFIKTDDGREMVIEKMALAYYYREAAQ